MNAATLFLKLIFYYNFFLFLLQLSYTSFSAVPKTHLTHPHLRTFIFFITWAWIILPQGWRILSFSSFNSFFSGKVMKHIDTLCLLHSAYSLLVFFFLYPPCKEKLLEHKGLVYIVLYLWLYLLINICGQQTYEKLFIIINNLWNKN